MPGVLPQFLNASTQSSQGTMMLAAPRHDVASVFDHAAQYQETATSVRIGNSVRTGASTGVNRNLERAQITSEQVIRERKEKRSRDVGGSVLIGVCIYHWKFGGSSTVKSKMHKVCARSIIPTRFFIRSMDRRQTLRSSRHLTHRSRPSVHLSSSWPQ
jgi:hypothetical protein